MIINHEAIVNDLKEIDSKLDTATLEYCVSILQLLSNSLKILNNEKKRKTFFFFFLPFFNFYPILLNNKWK